MCITIATTFTVAWVPFQLNYIVLVYGNVIHALMVHNAFKILAYINSCVNPAVYALMWRPFRQSLIQVRHDIVLLISLDTVRFTHYTLSSVSVRQSCWGLKRKNINFWMNSARVSSAN